MQSYRVVKDSLRFAFDRGPSRPSWMLSAVWLLLLVPAAPAQAADAPLALPDAVRQALGANLDLAARRATLAADREQIAIARAALLPRIDIGAQGQILEDDRSDGDRGNVTQRSATVNARLQQILYDEDDWANFEIQRYVYAAQAEQFRAFRLSVAGSAANTFLELDRSLALMRVQEQNRAITQQNIETSRARIAAGYSSETEVLRWRAQLAANNADLTGSQTRALTNRFELNRVRDVPREAPVSPQPATVHNAGFMYARDTIAKAIATPDGDQALRDIMVRVALARSPILAEAAEAIAAAERQLKANRRAFWIPSLILSTGINHLAANNSGSTGDFNKTEWGVGAALTFPLLEGGAKFASERQAAEYLSALRTQRRADALSLGQRVRSSFAMASGTYATLGFAQQQAAAARRYFELTNDSYVLGVASLIQLLDAQTELLNGELAVANARYEFLEALVAAEQEIAFFPFLEPDAEVARLLDQIEAELGATP